MIALPPAVVVQQCIPPSLAEARRVQTVVELNGDAAAVASVMASPTRPSWSVTSDTMEGNRRHVVLTLDRTATYKQIGSFVYRAQTMALTVSTRTDPPICGMDQN